VEKVAAEMIKYFLRMKHEALSRLGRRSEAPAISWLMEVALSRPQLISLAAGFTDNESLPVREAREILDDILRTGKTGQPALQYGSTAGDPMLRELTAQDFRLMDGVLDSDKAYSAERMVITNGSQQMLYMVTEAMCDEGDIVLVEDPSYFVYLGILQSHGLEGRGIRITQEGIELDHLEATLARLKKTGEIKRVKMLYLVTYYQNPTGVTTSFEKKVAALKLLKQYEKAAGHPIYLLEDAAYRELRFAGEDEKSALAAKGFANRVIYAGTYSKPFATGTRVGFGILPDPVYTAVVRIKGNHDFGTSNLLQQLLIHAINSGKYEKHLTALRRRYAKKAKTMLSALRQYFPKDVQWWEPQGGLYFWARLPKGIAAGQKSKLFQRAVAQDVLYVPGELCYANDPTRRKPDNEMRLSFGGGTEENIHAGIARLGGVLKKFVSKSGG
jgi:2-aminoadipate transaminase